MVLPACTFSCSRALVDQSIWGKSINLTTLGLPKTTLIIAPAAPKRINSHSVGAPFLHQPPVGTPKNSSIRGKYVVAVMGWGHDESPDACRLQFGHSGRDGGSSLQMSRLEVQIMTISHFQMGKASQILKLRPSDTASQAGQAQPDQVAPQIDLNSLAVDHDRSRRLSWGRRLPWYAHNCCGISDG